MVQVYDILDLGTVYTVSLGSPVLDLLMRPLRRSKSEIWDLQLINQIALFVAIDIICCGWKSML